MLKALMKGTIDLDLARFIQKASARGIATLAFVSLFGLTACSKSMFTGNTEDTGVKNNAGYRRVNVSCSGIDLSQAEIDVPTFRSLLGCFNSFGALDPVVKLVDGLSDDDLQPIVTVGNKYIVSNRKFLYQTDVTYQAITTDNSMDQKLFQLGRLLENQEFISSAIALFEDQYYVSRGGILRAASPDRDLLKAIELLSTKLTTDAVADGIDGGMTLVRSRAFQALEGDLLHPSHRPVRELSDHAWEFLTGPHDPRVKQEFIPAVTSGALFEGLDQVMGMTQDDIARNVMGVVAGFEGLLGPGSNGNALLDDTSSLFHYLDGPIPCMKGAEAVPNGAMYVIHELDRIKTADAASFVKRGNLLTLVGLNSVCSYPPELARYYPSVEDLADRHAFEPTVDLLKSFYHTNYNDPMHPGEKHNLVEFLIHVFGDTGADNRGGFKNLIPILAELRDREALEDAILVGALPPVDQRQRLMDIFSFLTASRAELGNRSIMDVVSDAIARSDKTHLYNFVQSLGTFLDMKDPLMDPALTELRKAFYINDVHPLIDLVRSIAADASENDRFFGTLFMVSERPEFKDTIKLFSDMAKDGRLKQLLGAVVTLFHQYAMSQPGVVQPTTEPEFVAHRRHNLCSMSADSSLHLPPIAPFVDGVEPAVSSSSCRNLDILLPLSDTTAGGFQVQLDNFLDCMNADGAHGDVVSAGEYLDHHNVKDGRSLLGFTMDLIKGAELRMDELQYLTNQFLTNLYATDGSHGPFLRLMDAVPYFVEVQVKGHGDPTGPVLRPLFDLLPPLFTADARPSFERLSSYGARIIERDDIPELLGYAERLTDKAWADPSPYEPVSQPEHQSFNYGMIEQEVKQIECKATDADAQARAYDITDEYTNQVTTWDLGADGKPKRSWEKADLKTELSGLFKKLQPSQGVPERSGLDALLNFNHYFTLAPGQAPNQTQQFSRDWVQKFLLTRSNDHKMIPYFYQSGKPGGGLGSDPPYQDTPNVRIVNTLDRFELIVENADYIAPIIGVNFALKFLASIGEAWGDEPRALWPPEIQKKFPPGSRPQTLKEAVDSIKSTLDLFEYLGFPSMPDCAAVGHRPGQHAWDDFMFRYYNVLKSEGVHLWRQLDGGMLHQLRASIFDNAQILPVLYENLPLYDSSGNPLAIDCVEDPTQAACKGHEMAGGMKFFRNLFFEVYYSTPEKYRDPGAGDQNNLSIITTLVRIGYLHQMGHVLRKFEPGDPTLPVLTEFFHAMADVSLSPDLKDIAARLVVSDSKQKLINKLIDIIFDVVDAADPNMDPAKLSAERQQELAGKTAAEQRQIRAGWVQEEARAKQAFLYMMPTLGSLHLVDPAFASLSSILAKFEDYLIAKSDQLETAIRNRKVSLLLRAIYEDPDSDPKARLSDLLRDAMSDRNRGVDAMTLVKSFDNDDQAKKAWDLFTFRSDAVTALPEYKNLRLDDVTHSLRMFLEGQSDDPQARELSAKLRGYTGRLLESGQIEELLMVLRDNPNDFYRVLETVSRHDRNGELKDFFDLIRRALSESN